MQRTNPDGTLTTYAASALNGAQPQGERRVMDCIDCHNRAAHSFVTPEEAINRAMAGGAISPSLPFIHKEGLALLKNPYNSEDEARVQISQQLEAFYRSQHPEVLTEKAALVKDAEQELYLLYSQNVFPFMKVTWGTHPNHIGHQDDPGCFRCHDGDHVAKGGASITQDCSACHNLLAVEEAQAQSARRPRHPVTQYVSLNSAQNRVPHISPLRCGIARAPVSSRLPRPVVPPSPAPPC